MPPKGTQANATPRKRGRPKKVKNANDDPEDTAVPQAIIDIEADPTDPWGPLAEVKTQLHPESQSWSLGMQPHFNYANLRTLVSRDGVDFTLPGYFTGDFSWDQAQQPVDDLAEPAARLKRKQEWDGHHLPGAKAFLVLKSTGISYNMLATYCHYTSPNACAEWQHTCGKYLTLLAPRLLISCQLA